MNPNYKLQVQGLEEPTGAITSSTLNPGPSLQYETPKEPPLFPVAGLMSSQPTPELQMTDQEKQAQDFSSQILAINSRLSEEATYRNEQAQKQGVTGLDNDIADLTGRLDDLKNESLAIPLQLQQQAQGRGITTGGLQPHQTAALRENAIKSIAVGAQIAGKQRQLTRAMALIDEAVKQKFGPEKARLEAATKNLELIMKSPAYALADKNRAQRQLELQDEKKRRIAREEENYKTIQGLALAAQQNGAPDAVIDAMMNAKDLTSALKVGRGYTQKETATSIQEYEYAQRNGYTGSFTDYQNEDANRKAIATGATGLSTQQTQNFLRITDKFQADGVIKAGQQGSTAIQIADRVIANPSSAGAQLSILYTLVKSLDPESAVREGEIALADQTNSFLGKFQKTFTRINEGQIIHPTAAVELANETKLLAKSWADAAQRREKQYKSQAGVAGIGDAFQQYIGGSELSYKPTLKDYYQQYPENRQKVQQLIQENPDLSDEDILEILNFSSVGGDTKTSLNRPQRNNNPLNIKWSQVTMKYPGVKGKDPKPATDGGYFLTFNSPQDGFNAAKRLIQTDGYKNLTVDAALKRWSNKGYGGEIIPSLKGRTINSLSPAELDKLIKTMAAQEGYTA